MISKRTGKSTENLRKYASVEAIILRIFLSVTASSGLPNLVFLRVFTSITISSFRYSANNVKKRVKVPASTPKRKQRMVCLMSEEEVRIVDCYLKKYKITNKARWLRETVLTFIHQKMEEDYPTLFNEHDMRR